MILGIFSVIANITKRRNLLRNSFNIQEPRGVDNCWSFSAPRPKCLLRLFFLRQIEREVRVGVTDDFHRPRYNWDLNWSRPRTEDWGWGRGDETQLILQALSGERRRRWLAEVSGREESWVGVLCLGLFLLPSCFQSLHWHFTVSKPADNLSPWIPHPFNERHLIFSKSADNLILGIHLRSFN